MISLFAPLNLTTKGGSGCGPFGEIYHPIKTSL
jgi:hypothetical protein